MLSVNKKHFFFSKFLPFILVPGMTLASVYYVSNNGSNDADGRSESNAFATLSKAASAARSGDTIKLRRGDVFRESVSLPDRVSLKFYGDAYEPPVISGAEKLGPWGGLERRQFIAVASASHRIANLFVNGKIMRIARYPNSGWLRTTSNNHNSTVVTCQALTSHPRNADGYWNGCRMRWRHWSWYFDTRIITDYKADGMLTLAGKPSTEAGNNQKGWGFYIDGNPNELDTAGEWYYDEGSKVVYLYSPAGFEFNDSLIEGAWAEKGISASNALIEGICFRHFTNTGLEITRNSIVRNCRFEGIGSDSGGAGLAITWDAQGVVVESCSFSDCLNLAVSWIQNPSNKSPSYLANCRFRNIGSTPGYGGSGPWHAAAVIVYAGRNIHIKNNIFDTTGYAAIIFGDPGNFAEYNIIRNPMWTLNDGAGIYTNCDSSTIRHNIIMYAGGGWESTGWEIRLAHGIWPEFLEHFKCNIIDSNTCAFNNGNGVFLPNNFHSLIRGNVCYANLSDAQMHIEGGFYTDDNLPLYDTITGNVFYSVDPNGMALTYRPEYDYGVISGNYYCNPNSINLIGEYDKAGWNVKPHTIEWWKNNWRQADKTAKTDIIKRPPSAAETDPTGRSQLLINTNTTPQWISTGDDGIYLDLDSNIVHGGVEIPAFYSIVVVHTGKKASIRKSKDNNHKQQDCIFIPSEKPRFIFPMESDGIVNVNIFDPLGRVIATPVNGLFKAGIHEIPCISKITAKGLYIYKLTGKTGNRTSETVKIKPYLKP